MGDVTCCITNADMLITCKDHLPKIADVKDNESQVALMQAMPECTKEEFEATIDDSILPGRLFRAIFKLSVMEDENPGEMSNDEEKALLQKILEV